MQTGLPARSERSHEAGASDSSTMRPHGRYGSRQVFLGVRTGDGPVDVHLGPQRSVGVEFLHPERRTVSHWVHAVVGGQRVRTTTARTGALDASERTSVRRMWAHDPLLRRRATVSRAR